MHSLWLLYIIPILGNLLRQLNLENVPCAIYSTECTVCGFCILYIKRVKLVNHVFQNVYMFNYFFLLLFPVTERSMFKFPLELLIWLFHCCLVAQSCLFFCEPMNCNPPGSSSMVFSGQEYWSGLPFPPPGDLPHPRIKLMFPCLLPCWPIIYLVAQMVNNLYVMQETWVPSLDLEDPLEKRMATHSSILAWRSPWTEESARLHSMGSLKAGHIWGLTLSLHFTFFTDQPLALAGSNFALGILRQC